CTAQERRAFEAWLAASPRHAEEYGQFERLWQAAGQLKPRQAPAPRRTAMAGWRQPLRAVAMVLVGVPLLAWSGWEAGWLPNSYHRYQAENERRQLTLPDGSEVELDLRTGLSFANFKDARQLDLTRGVVYVHASHSAEHPFKVKAGRVTVTVTGTRFSVWAFNDEVMVTVAEGAVKVRSHGDGDDAVLTPGTQAHYRPGDASPSVGPADLDSALAWRGGRLVLQDMPLAQALPLINRYLDQPLVLADAATGGLRIGGVFSTSNMPALVTGLPKVLPVTLSQGEGSLRVSLRR
uniref:FecR family protein n=1 Tax=Pseudomonas sp. RIT-PI-S TaxID=3035295 RepID=UPI0021D8D7B0